MYAKLALIAVLVSRIAVEAVAPSEGDLVPNNDVYDDMPLYANYDNSIPDANELDNTILMHADNAYNEPNEYSILTPRADHSNKRHYKAEPNKQHRADSEIHVPRKAGQKSKAKSHHMAGPGKPGHQTDQGSHKDLDPEHKNSLKDQKELVIPTAPGTEIPDTQTRPHPARPTGSRAQPMRQPGPAGTNPLNGLPVPRQRHSTHKHSSRPKHPSQPKHSSQPSHHKSTSKPHFAPLPSPTATMAGDTIPIVSLKLHPKTWKHSTWTLQNPSATPPPQLLPWSATKHTDYTIEGQSTRV